MGNDITRYSQRNQLARRVRRHLHEPEEQMQYIVAVTEAAQEYVSHIYKEGNEIGVTTLVRANALIQAAALAGAPEAALQQLEGTQQDLTAAIRHITAGGAGKIAMLQSQTSELSEASVLDVLDRWGR
jgi:hypothetical protein